MYAEVIVDVATMQTNQPYTYVIPSEFVNQIEVGMRVVVGFGRGNRRVQGFITKILAETTLAGPIKPILSIQDITPVLNTEAMLLADWLAKYTFSFKISCLQALLPSAMRAKYLKTLRLKTQDVSHEVLTLFEDKDEINFDDDKISSNLRAELVRLCKKDKLEIISHVKDKVQVKKVPAIIRILDDHDLQLEKSKLRQTAAKQLVLLNYLLNIPVGKEILQADIQAKTGLTAVNFKNGATKGWLRQVKVEKYRNPYMDVNIKATKSLKLLPQQQEATKKINDEILQHNHRVFLLQGVTGSGKTEVYLQSIAYALKQGKQALMLVPEISLTPQITRLVKSRFGQDVAMLHSGLSEGEKYDEWRRIERKEANVVVGTRSAIFAPLTNIGIIIVDEEHESSYKQEDMPRYHARDVAIWRGKYHDCPVILGSATPSLETRARAQKNVYGWLQLTQRANGNALPQVKLVDMRQKARFAPAPDISSDLLQVIQNRLNKKEQVVLMLNRRGYSSFVMCRECGFVLKCPNCDISLTLHMNTRSMRCHYCGHEEAIPQSCPSCRGKHIGYYGTGTEKIETELQGLLPTARILRMDVDTTRRKGAHERLLTEFGEKKADILLGTQMIAKGLNFPNVTLVGVLNADTALELPDFRASEKTFQLLTQVSGRAGRAEKKGEVLVQTFNPDNYAIKLAQAQNYEQYFSKEMRLRHRGGYPPYYYTIQITTSFSDEITAAKKIFQIAEQLKQVLTAEAQILGPTPRSIMRINNRYYYQLVIKYKNEPKLNEYLQKLLIHSQKDERKGLKLIIDRDPRNFI